MKTTIAASAAILLASGCAGSLVVYDHTQTEVKGVPFRTAEVYVKKGVRDKLAKGGSCAESAFVDTVLLPTGAQYYVIAKPAQFAKTGFHVKYHESGAVSEISLDSEPSGAESIKAAGEFLKNVLPLVGVAAAAAAPAAADARVGPACDSGEKDVKFQRLDDYMKEKR